MQGSAAPHTRRNPLPSHPTTPDVEESSTIPNGMMNGTQSLDGTGWREPPLKAPAPSFTEYKGLERQGVLERMMPLGTFPTAKVNARKKGEPLRRTVQARNLEGMELDDSRATPDDSRATPDVNDQTDGTPVAESTRASSARTEERATASTPLMEEQAARPFTPDQPEARFHTTAPATPSLPNPSSAMTQRQFSLPPVPRLVNGSPFDRALKLATHRSHMATAHQVPWVNAFAHHDAEFGQILTTMSTIPHPADRPVELMNAYERKVRKMKSKLKKAQRAHGSTQLPFVEQDSLPTSPQTSQSHPVSSLPKRLSNTTIAPTTHQEPSATNEPSAAFSPAHKKSSPLKMTLNLNRSPASRREKSSNSNGLISLKTRSPLKSTEMSTGGHSRRSSSSELSPVDEDVVDAPPDFLEPNQSSTAGIKRTAADASLLGHEDHVREAKSKQLRRDFNDVTTQSSDLRNRQDRPLRSPKPRPTVAERARQIHLRALNRSAYGANGHASPAMNGSKEQTPPTSLGRPPKNPTANQKRMAKLKLSPQKDKKSAVIAGVARPDNHRRAGSVGDDDRSDSSENNDYCSACGGNGFMLCCDGCPRSYHFTCVDPPIDQTSSLDDPWFCYKCMARKAAPKRQEPGLFAALLQQVEKKNPESFKLPDYVRDFFEGVRTGDDGEYIENVPQKPTTRARTGYDEAADWQRLKDAKGNTILCYSCGKSSLDHRDIIPCDYCSLHWHLDCLDPPLANPPNRGYNSRTRPAWMCPTHVDHDLKHLDPIMGDGAEHDGFTKAHRVRRPKNPRIVDVAMRRGFRNQGLIEIADDGSDDSGFESEEGHDGVIFSLKPKGIVLDFIDKVKRNDETDRRQARRRAARTIEEAAQLKLETERARLQNERETARRLQDRSLSDRQTAFYLTQLGANNPNLNLSTNQLDNLTYTAEAEAPPMEGSASGEASTQANGTLSTAEKKAELIKQRERIDRELAALEKGD